MTFEQQYQVFREQYCLFNLTLEEQTELFNLVGFVYLSFKSKSPDTKINEITAKLIGGDRPADKYLINAVSIQTLSLIDACNFVPSSMGLKNAAEIKVKIKEILHNWLPF